MFRKWCVVVWLGFAVCFGFQSASADIINGDFSNPLTIGWTSKGDASVEDQGSDSDPEVILSDESIGYSNLYQGVALSPGSYTLNLDFISFSSGMDPTYSFPDSFYATLYFIDDFPRFDLDDSVFDDALALFDLDNRGLSLWAGGFSDSGKGTGWRHYSVTFQNKYGNVIPTFELYDGNSFSDDSKVFLDNISITEATTPVPEPGTLMLLAAGLASIVGLQIRHKRNHLA